MLTDVKGKLCIVWVLCIGGAPVHGGSLFISRVNGGPNGDAVDACWSEADCYAVVKDR
jgi:hypothetical protein